MHHSGKTSFPDWESSPGRGGESAQYSPLDHQGAMKAVKDDPKVNHTLIAPNQIGFL